MSKSLGNVLAIPAVLQRVRPAELRYYLGSAHYRSMLEFSETALQDAVKAYTGIEDFLHRVRSRVGAVVPGEWTPKFAAALDDDLSVPIALAEVHAARAEGNRALDAGDHDAAMAHARSIRAMMGILGADPLDERWESRDETSAALAAVDVLVQWALRQPSRRPRPPRLGGGRRRSATGSRRPASRSPTPPTGRSGRCWTGTASRWLETRGAGVRSAKPGRRRGRRSGPAVCAGAGWRAAVPPRRRTCGPTIRPPSGRPRPSSSDGRPSSTDDTEIVLGRNPVLECLRAGVPATALYVALGTEADERLTESVRLAADSGISILEVPRHDLDRISANGLHQGIALQVPPYHYAHPDDLLAAAASDGAPALLVALDNISDPRNLGAIVRSVAAFAGHGVLIPQRRSASVTAVAWRTSAGAAARVPVARATNLNRTLKNWGDAGLQVVGLDADGDTTLDDLDGTGPLVVVVGSEGKGLSRLVRENCDAVVSIPMAGPTESLNASVAAGVVLAEIARQRRK